MSKSHIRKDSSTSRREFVKKSAALGAALSTGFKPTTADHYASTEVDSVLTNETAVTLVDSADELRITVPKANRVFRVKGIADFRWSTRSDYPSSGNVLVVRSRLHGFRPGDINEGRWVSQPDLIVAHDKASMQQIDLTTPTLAVTGEGLFKYEPYSDETPNNVDVVLPGSGKGRFVAVVGRTRYDLATLNAPTGNEDLDTKAVQDVLNEAPSGAEIHLRSGYVVSKLELSARSGNATDHLVLEGHGALLKCGRASVAGAEISRPALHVVGEEGAPIIGLTIRNLVVDGGFGDSTTVVQPPLEEQCIHLAFVNKVVLENVEVRGWRTGKSSVWDGLNPCPFQLLNVKTANLTRCRAQFIGGEAFDIRNSQDIVVEDCTAEDIGYGALIIRYCEDVLVSNFRGRRTGRAYNDISLGTLAGQRLKLTHCSFRNHGADFTGGIGSARFGAPGFNFHSTPLRYSYEDIQIVDCEFKRMRSAAFAQSIQLSPELEMRRLVFRGNRFHEMYQALPGFRFVDGLTVSENEFDRMANGIISICDDRVSSRQRPEGLSRVTIVSNRFYSLSSSCVQLQTGGRDNFLTDVTFENNKAVNCSDQTNVFWFDQVSDWSIRNNSVTSGAKTVGGTIVTTRDNGKGEVRCVSPAHGLSQRDVIEVRWAGQIDTEDFEVATVGRDRFDLIGSRFQNPLSGEYTLFAKTPKRHLLVGHRDGSFLLDGNVTAGAASKRRVEISGLREASLPSQITRSQVGGGSPQGVLTPRYIGDEYFDSNSKRWYKSHGLTAEDWGTL